MRWQQLDRDAAVEARIVGLVDLAHAARAQRGHDLVGAEALAFIESQSASAFVLNRCVSESGTLVKTYEAL